MTTQLELAKNRLYAPGGLDVKNFSVSPGTGREVTSEQVAREINRSLSRIEAGEFEEVKPEEA